VRALAHTFRRLPSLADRFVGSSVFSFLETQVHNHGH
jgi:hypothetical protein